MIVLAFKLHASSSAAAAFDNVLLRCKAMHMHSTACGSNTVHSCGNDFPVSIVKTQCCTRLTLV